MIPFGDASRRPRRSPVITTAIIAVNAFVFILELTGGDPFVQKWSVIPADIVAGQHWITILTAMFMHGGWLHLILNMWTLWIFGPAMEARFGRLGFAVLYLVGGAVASFTHLIANLDSAVPALGASGAIAAVIAAYAVIYPRERVLLIVPLGILFIPLWAPAVLFALIWFGIQVLQGTHALFAPSMGSGVAWWAHIGGFAFGALAALPVRHTGWARGMRTSQWNAGDFPNSRGRFPGPWSRD